MLSFSDPAPLGDFMLYKTKVTKKFEAQGGAAATSENIKRYVTKINCDGSAKRVSLTLGHGICAGGKS